jgi:Icc-related predicted phosphoesterase
MRIQIFSDLHADVRTPKPITIGADVDVVIAAGDICEGAVQSFAVLRDLVPMAVPIVFVLGNHEYYRSFVTDELAVARERAPAHNVHLLENDAIVINGVRFVGATLWTDYALFGAEWRPQVMEACRHGLNDHRLIGWRKQPWERFRPQEALLLHQQSRDYLEAAIAQPFPGATVVVTHHAPHPGSIAPRYRTDLLTGGFASDCEGLILAGRPALWVHGHMHDSADYRVADTRMVCNPHGYGNENPAFDPALIVEIG